MKKSKPPGGDIESPDESLSHYFDDLLGIGDAIDEAFVALDARIMPAAMSSGSGRVVSLPTKKPQLDKPSVSPVAPVSNPVAYKKNKSKVLADPELLQTPEQKRQLERLLQSANAQLLVEPPKVDLTTAVVQQPVATPTAHFIADPTEIQEWDIGTSIEEVTPAELAAPPVEAVDLNEAADTFKMDGLEWLENGRPQWAQSRFDVLLFKVAGLTLAVPLISLGQIQPLTDELTPLFGQADWFMGLQPTPAGKIRTVNTAKFVMPERYDQAFLKTAKYVMSINGVPWGLAVDSVNQPITLQPDDVKWRGDRSKRPWLAGTVKDHMCALLDIPRIGQMLIEADKNFVTA